MIGLLSREVKILTPTASSDRYGDSHLSWDDPDEVTVAGWVFQQSSTTDRDGRLATLSTTVLYLPADTTITVTDRVAVDGVTYEVDAEPNRVHSPRGEHHVEVTLRRVVG